MKKKRGTGRQKMLYIVCLFFLLGTVGGAAMANCLPLEEQSSLFLFLQQVGEKQQIPSFGAYFWKYLKYGVLIWLGGWMQMGIFFSGAVFLFRSVSLGFTSAMLFLTHGEKGIFHAVISILPQNLLLIPAYTLLMWSALYYMLHWKEEGGKRALKRERRRKQAEYCIILGGGIVLLAGASGVEYLLLIG